MKSLKSILLLSFLLVSIHANSQTFADFLNRINSVQIEDRQAIADSMIESMSEASFPITEDSLAHFVYQGNSTSPVLVAGDFNGWDPSNDSMLNIEETDLHYLSKTFERDARLDYKYITNGGNWILDPLNPNRVSGGYGPNSELAMPNYIQPWQIIEQEGVEKGSIDKFSFKSEITNNSRQVQVYLPPNYEANTTRIYPTLYVNDGSEYVMLGSMPNVLDNLIDAGEIAEMIVVFVDPKDRNSEYWFNHSYLQMLVGELIPHIATNYRVVDNPEHRGIMGASLGGLVSAWTCINYPDVFALCGSQSGAFWIDNQWIVDEYSLFEKQEIQFYLDWGSYELSIQESNLALVSVLEDKGYTYSIQEYHEGHSWGSWRAHTDDMLKQLFPPEEFFLSIPESPNEQEISIYPNPVRDQVTFRFSLEQSDNITLALYDQLGRCVKLSKDFYTTGQLKLVLEKPDLPDEGIYFYKISSPSKMLYNGKIIVAE